jgi:hypothetical protein
MFYPKENNPMTATMPIPNIRQKKSLGEQIDRLDHILDGLSEGLTGTIETAVRQAVTVAVEQAIKGIAAELLTNRDLLARLGMGPVTNEPVQPNPVPPANQSRVGGLVGKARSWLASGWRSLRGTVKSAACRFARTVSALWRQVRVLRHFRVPILAALVVGAVVGVIAYHGGPYVAAFAGWLAGFTTTLAVQAGLWLRQSLGSFVAATA